MREENLKWQQLRFNPLVWVLALAAAGGFGVSGCAVKERPLSQKEIQEEARFYGGNANFTATRVVTVRWGTSVERKETALAFSDGNMREERAASADLPALVTIRRPDLDTIYVYWPGETNVLVEQAYRSTRAHEASANASITKKFDIGQETIDGHPCIKCKAVVQGRNKKIEWTMWEATDLNRFPVRAEFAAGNKATTVEFTNVRIGKPDPSLFEPPTGYMRLGRKFKNTDEALAYMVGGLLRSMSHGGKGK
ncbi:MAG TPA: hypothetical protein VL486_02610 [Verrucomicrobiae bacterium]|nr:hypothetical protein [Verrucomicrobiae bacterium]